MSMAVCRCPPALLVDTDTESHLSKAFPSKVCSPLLSVASQLPPIPFILSVPAVNHPMAQVFQPCREPRLWTSLEKCVP